MSLLTIRDAATGAETLRTDDPKAMAEALTAIGVRFERWPVAALPEGAEADAVLAAYRPQLDAFLKDTKAGTADVIRLTADHPQKDAIRAKFLSEHIHTEDGSASSTKARATSSCMSMGRSTTRIARRAT